MGKRIVKKKIEYSKIMCTLIVIYGVANGILYNIQVFMDKAADPALAIQSVITIVGGFLSYLIYQFSCKNSMNKFGVTPDGKIYFDSGKNTEEE